MKKFLLENGRPDKPAACPRCNSFNTKFCYFNNYNVKQPRHFCRECQRYWTAGGSLRNVPVGAGRRKHKLASSKLYGSNTSTNSEGEGDECAYTSLKPYHSLPFKQLVGCSPDGIVQEIQSFKELGHDNVMPIYGNEKSRLPKFVTDATLDSEFAFEMNGYMQDTLVAEKLGCLQMMQKRAREPTMDTKSFKLKYEHEPGNPIPTPTHGAHDDDGHDGDAQHHMHDRACDDVHNDIEEGADKVVHDDVADKDAQVGSAHVGSKKDLLAEHDDSTCCSSVTAAITSTSSEGVSETNGSSPTAHTLTSETKPTGVESQLPIWGPLMWPPWSWPFILNRGNGAPGMMPQVDPMLALGLGAVASTGVLQGDSALTPGIQAESARNGPACIGPNFLQWPYMWNPLAWGLPWNVAWNGASMTSNNQHSQDHPKEKQGSLCYPKTLRMDHPDEAAYRSILSTLGVATPPQSPAGYFNAFQPKADVFQPKTTPQAVLEHPDRSEQSSPHVNPAAQARSMAFQEGG